MTVWVYRILADGRVKLKNKFEEKDNIGPALKAAKAKSGFWFVRNNVVGYFVRRWLTGQGINVDVGPQIPIDELKKLVKMFGKKRERD